MDRNDREAFELRTELEHYRKDDDITAQGCKVARLKHITSYL